MFSLLKSVFNRFSSASVPTPKMSSSELPPSKPENNTWVYIWNMTAKNVGHAAIQVGGSEPKMKAEDPGEYISIHPGMMPSAGITSVLPLDAQLATTLTEDMETMAASHNRVILDMDTPPQGEFEQHTTPLPPDRVFKLKGLDLQAMQNSIGRTQKSVMTGGAGYQLFPNVNLLGFFQDAATFINQDPIDVELQRRANLKYPRTSIEVDNCTSLVSKILDVGGSPVRHPKTPWGITPNELADEINRGPR